MTQQASLEGMRDRKGSDLSPAPRPKDKDRMTRRLRIHRDIERENDRMFREWKTCHETR